MIEFISGVTATALVAYVGIWKVLAEPINYIHNELNSRQNWVDKSTEKFEEHVNKQTNELNELVEKVEEDRSTVDEISTNIASEMGLLKTSVKHLLQQASSE